MLGSPSVQLSHSVVSDSLWPHGLQQARLPSPSPDNPDLTQTHVYRVGDIIQPSHLLLCPSPPAFNLSQNQSFPKSQLFTSGSQSIRVSASASVLPVNTQDSFPLGWSGLISLQSKGVSRVFPNTTVQKYQFFSTQPSLWPNSHSRTWLLEKP